MARDVDVVGAQEILSLLEQISSRAGQPSLLWQELSRWYTAGARAAFASQRWRKLSQRYARFKARTHPGRGILQRSGALYAGLTAPEVEDVSGEEAAVGIRSGAGASLFYGAVHHGGRGVPRRRLVPAMSRQAADELGGEFLDYVMRGR